MDVSDRNSSRDLGWLVKVGVEGLGTEEEEEEEAEVEVEGEEVAEAPASCCRLCSFCSRRSLRRSLAFRHAGLLGSAPTPESETQTDRERKGELSIS